MTMEEVAIRYGIPKKIFLEFKAWGLLNREGKDRVPERYDDSDLQLISLMITLHQIGFSSEEVRRYMKLMLEGEDTAMERMKMLNHRRKQALEEIHFREKQLENLDYLRHQIRSIERI